MNEQSRKEYLHLLAKPRHCEDAVALPLSPESVGQEHPALPPPISRGEALLIQCDTSY